MLSQLAGVPYKHLAHTVVSSVQVADGAASIVTAATTLTATANPVLCGSCAIIRWLRILDLAVTKINTKVIADAIDKTEALTTESPHLCWSAKTLDERTTEAPVFPPIDQWERCPSRCNP